MIGQGSAVVIVFQHGTGIQEAQNCPMIPRSKKKTFKPETICFQDKRSSSLLIFQYDPM